VLLSVAVLAIVLIGTPFIGSQPIDYRRALAGLSPDHEMLFLLRVPRVLLAALAGGSLAVAGVLFQALLRDSLATPYTLGISSGAALGAVIALTFRLREAIGLPGVWAGAFSGAAIALVLVLAIGSQGRRMSSFTLLLAGTTINSMCLAVIMFLQNLATFAGSFAIVHWLMGGIENESYSTLGMLAAVLLPLHGVAWRKAREWNVLSVGEEWASARGVPVARTMLLGYIVGSVITGAVTSLTGPIGFIGLIVPHALRLKWGADHRILLPCSFLLGAAFLVVCDTVARTVLAPTQIPVGVITALLGGPIFIWLLRSRRRSLWV
jgi:iron complex transport system permease protein